jgi:hypothetical protein
MASAHKDPRFTNSVEYTVTLRLRIAGGVKERTAQRWAQQAAQRLTGAAARLRHVVEVTATYGYTDGEGEVTWPRPVYFGEANSGPTSPGDPVLLSRYVDPDHQRALASLAAVNAAHRERRSADLARRSEVGCRNALPLITAPRVCDCVYCDTPGHAAAEGNERAHPGNPHNEPRCVCGQPVAVHADRCTRHRDATVVVLDGDHPDLTRLAAIAPPGRKQPASEQPPPSGPHAPPTLPASDRTASTEPRHLRPARDFGFDR